MTGTFRRTAFEPFLLLVLGGGLLVSSCTPGDAGASYDLVLLGGRVIDPASETDAVRNVGIQGDSVAAVTPEPIRGRDTIDASSHVVTPGFVDLHEHGTTPEAYRLMVRDGVTTAFELEVGTDSVEAWYQKRSGGRLVNYGVSVGHIPVRMAVMDDPGDFLPAGPGGSARADSGRLAEIERRVREGLRQGAVAVGFGTAYTPGATMDEVERMFGVAAELDAPAHVHIRNGAAGLDSTIAATRRAGASLHVVHVNSSGGDELDAFLRRIREAREAGQDVTTETYPYGAGMTRIESALFDDWRSYPDSQFHRYQWVETGERLTRQTFAEARRQGGFVVIHSRSEDQTRRAVSSPLTIIASDGFIEDGQGHPRTSGTYSKVLGTYVREEGRLSLMEALRKMTIMPARRLEARVPEMREKGRLQVGADADITVFDPGTVIDRSTYTDATIPPEGIPWVLVRGTPVVAGGELVEDARSGRAVRAPRGEAGDGG